MTVQTGDIVSFNRTGRNHQVRQVAEYGVLLCGFVGVVQLDEVTLVSKATPRNSEFDGMSADQIRSIIRQRVQLAAERTWKLQGITKGDRQ